jgi:hypothetical protein
VCDRTGWTATVVYHPESRSVTWWVVDDRTDEQLDAGVDRETFRGLREMHTLLVDRAMDDKMAWLLR